jgi:hypothetical protein
MKRLAFAACIAMAGCAASPIEVAQQKCAAEPDATRERCLVTTAQAEHQKRQAVAAALMGVQSYANARAAGAQAAADSYRPPIETTCRQAPGGVTRCTTY